MATELERIVEVEQRSKSNTHRIDALETNYEALRKITSSIEVMAVKMQNISEKVDSLDSKVNDAEKVPAARWNLLINTLLTGAVGAIVGAIVAAIFH